MAQFLKAKFLSEALKWKADPRHANDQFFAGLRYNPYIFAQARMVFPEYHKRFPYPADKEFVENFVRDLNNPTKNKEILKIINPEIITPELEAANQQFEVESRLEQQQVTQATGQIPPQPFSLSAAVTHSATPRIIIAAAPPATEESTGIPAKTPTQTIPETAISQPPIQTPSQPPPPKAQRPLFQAPRIPASFTNTVKNIGSGAGVFFKKNVGKYITAGRIATVVSGGIGAITGGALTNGSAIGMLGGGGLGAIAPSWIRSGEGTKFLGQIGNGAINFGANLSNQVSSGATRLSMSSGSKKWALGLLGAFILFFGISLFGGLTETTPPGKAGPLPSPGGGDISKCTFTRAGNPQLIKSSILSGWISSAAASVGIAPQVLASVAMHENQDFVANADNNHDAIKSNQFCNRGLQFCELNGQVLHSNPDANDPCTPDEIANGARTAQAVGLMQLLDIYNPGKDLCSITENLSIAAAKLKADGITSQPTQEQVNRAIRQYYNSCTYGTYSYCDEVWQDYQNCRVQPSASPGRNLASCPLAGSRTITCGSYGSDPIYNASFCNGPQPEDRGHCGNTYGSSRCGSTPEGARNSRRAHAIDVAATPGETVYLPTVEGKSVTWNHILEGSVSPADGGGYWHYFGAILGADQWFLYLIHVDASLIGFSGGKDHYESGDTVTTIAATTNPHAHVNIGKNPEGADSGAGWFNPEDIGMCTR